MTTAPARTPLDAEELRRLEVGLMSIMRGVMGSHHQFDSGLDKAGYVVLNALHRMGEVRQTDLAGRMQLDLSTISRQVKSLEELGFVRRTADPDDRRASVLTVTAAGRREITKQRQTRWAPVAARLSEVAPDDRERFLAFLEQLADLSHHAPAGAPTGKAHR